MSAADGKVITNSEAVDYGILPSLLGYQLRRAQLTVFQKFAARLRELTVTPTQFAVLVLIGANPGLTQRALSEAVATDQSTLVSLLDRLESRSLVERQRSSHDRRYQVLTLTAKGETQTKELCELVSAHDDELAAAFSAQERTAFMEFLERFNRG
ncbi:MAG: MarR family winged helix-turn-helix transcriptional regulator [Alphaproteobacteria bacterium]|nr:MarR family winged helix-turn-helix transcriptional regulator [Alphaproteobacteria bacterium]